MKGILFRAASLLLPLLLASCGTYQAIPWNDAPGRADAVQALGGRLVSGLEEGVKEANLSLSRFRARNARGGEEQEKVFRVVVAAFPEARTGVRTAFSQEVEEAVRRALGQSTRFRVVDGGEGVAWQEAAFRPPAAGGAVRRAAFPSAPTVRRETAEEDDEAGFFDNIPFGEWRAEAHSRKSQGKAAAAGPEVLDRELDGDHPQEGLWPQVRGRGAFGESSAVYAASIFGADAAIYGAYALGPGRVRVWAAVVLNTAPRTIYYTRGIKDIFGLPERVLVGRIYPAYARDQLPRSAVADEALIARAPSKPRLPPRHPPFWGEPALDVKLEEIDSRGERQSLTVRNMVAAKSLVVGRLAARRGRHVYAFALNKEGEAEEIFSSAEPGRQGWARRVEAGRFLPFAARIVEPGRLYRLYFVSASGPFEGKRAVEAARRRLGLKERGIVPARTARDVAGGAPPEAWHVEAGQERLILEQGWDQQVFWLYRQESR